MTKAELLKEGGIGYMVGKRPLYYYHNEERIVSPYHVEVARLEEGGEFDGAPLGVVGAGYGLVQNTDVVEICEVWNEEGKASYVACGAPDDGKRIYIVMKTPDTIVLGPNEGDKIQNYFFLTTAHDGSEAIVAYPTPMHVGSGSLIVPANKTGGAIKIKHTKHVMRYVAHSKKIMRHLAKFWEEFAKSALLFAETKLPTQSAFDYFTMILSEDGKVPKDLDLGSKKNTIRDRLIEIYKTGPTSKMPYGKNTLLGAYLAVTTYADHDKLVRDSKKKGEVAARLEALLIKDGVRMKAEALGFALKLQQKFAHLREGR
jgi:phage/plasmid-like protein (TIGR03299 family)